LFAAHCPLFTSTAHCPSSINYTLFTAHRLLLSACCPLHTITGHCPLHSQNLCPLSANLR
jgi:hypothetical protein